MKAMKRHRIKFFSQVGVIGTLAAFGLIAISGEPVDESRWLETVIMQIMVWISCWGATAWLCRHWGLNRVLNMLTWIERSRRIEF